MMNKIAPTSPNGIASTRQNSGSSETIGASAASFGQAVRATKAAQGVEPVEEREARKQQVQPEPGAQARTSGIVPAYDTVAVMPARDALEPMASKSTSLAVALEAAAPAAPGFVLVTDPAGGTESIMSIRSDVYMPVDLFDAWVRGGMDASASSQVCDAVCAALDQT